MDSNNQGSLYARFLEVGFQAFMTEETKRLGEILNKQNTPGKSTQKSQQKTPIEILHEFNENLIEIALKILTHFEYKDIYYSLANIVFEFFH
jgi:hypothetical protein